MNLVTGWSRCEGSYETYITNRNTINVNVNGNYFLENKLGGDHEIRFGVDYYTGTTTSQSLYPQQRMLYVYRSVIPLPATTSNLFPNRNLDVTFNRISGYIGDTINFGKLTVGLGLRYDRESGIVNPNTQPNFFWVEPGSVHDGELLYNDLLSKINSAELKVPAAWATISPRLSFTYDITGDGKNVAQAVRRHLRFAERQQPDRRLYSLSLYLCSLERCQRVMNVATYDELGDEFQHASIDAFDRATGLNRVTLCRRLQLSQTE